MVVDQTVGKKNLNIKICPLCKKELPLFQENSYHNFCPHSLDGGKIVDVCIICKMMFIDGKWQI